MPSRVGDSNVLVYEDEARQHTDEEVAEYAEFLQIDPVLEPHLMWIAREGIAANIPHPWKACQEDGSDEVFYFNFETSESVWDHPSDEKYRQMADDERRKYNIKLSQGSGRPAPAALPSRTFTCDSAFTDVSEGGMKSPKRGGDKNEDTSSSSSEDAGVDRREHSADAAKGGDDPERLAMLTQVKDMEEKHGDSHPEVAKALVRLASHQGMNGEPELQKESLEKALQIQERHYGKEHASLADTLTSLAVAHSALGNSEDERRCFERAEELWSRDVGSEEAVANAGAEKSGGSETTTPSASPVAGSTGSPQGGLASSSPTAGASTAASASRSSPTGGDASPVAAAGSSSSPLAGRGAAGVGITGSPLAARGGGGGPSSRVRRDLTVDTGAPGSRRGADVGSESPSPSDFAGSGSASASVGRSLSGSGRAPKGIGVSGAARVSPKLDHNGGTRSNRSHSNCSEVSEDFGSGFDESLTPTKRGRTPSLGDTLDLSTTVDVEAAGSAAPEPRDPSNLCTIGEASPSPSKPGTQSLAAELDSLADVLRSLRSIREQQQEYLRLIVGPKPPESCH